MKILITGGLGNLGSWITGHLLEKGFEITTFSSRDRNVLRDRKLERIFGSVENEKDLEKLFLNNSWDAIIHLASINEADLANYHRRALIINSLGTRNLLQALASGGQTNTHFIYFSTFHIYGANSGIVTEDTVLPEPKNDYAATHLFAEYYVKQFHVSHKIPFTTFRLTNSYGAPKDTESSKWYLILNDLARMAAEKNLIKLSSNGQPRRDFIWMGDVCDAVEKCIRKGAANTTFNLGSGQTISMSEVAETVQKAHRNYFSRVIEIEKNNADKNQYDNTLTVSIEKLQNWIEFKPKNKMYEEAIAVLQMLRPERV